MAFDTSQEMTEILIQWYLESFEIKIPVLQYTNDDFEFSTHWQQKRMDYTTKVLYPVLSEMMINSPQPEKELTKPQLLLNEPFPSDNSLEDLCVTWGGYVHGIELDNTCPMDNFVTLLSLHKDALLTTFELIHYSPNSQLKNILSLIGTRQFDQVRLQISQMLGIPLSNSQYNLLGYEGHVVQLLCNVLSLCSDKYIITFSAGAAASSLKTKLTSLV